MGCSPTVCKYVSLSVVGVRNPWGLSRRDGKPLGTEVDCKYQEESHPKVSDANPEVGTDAEKEEHVGPNCASVDREDSRSDSPNCHEVEEPSHR